MANANASQEASPSRNEDTNNDTNNSLSDVLNLTHRSIETLQGFLSQMDSMVGKDFHEIIDKINATRMDMDLLSETTNADSPIPQAGNELREVVRATENATDRIMHAAETIMTADQNDQAAYAKIVEENLMEIFEACSFQDLTGQRINRVVDTLEFVDYRIHKIATLLGIEQPEAYCDKKADEIKEKQDRKDELLLHGPQDAEEAISQSAIDDLF